GPADRAGTAAEDLDPAQAPARHGRDRRDGVPARQDEEHQVQRRVLRFDEALIRGSGGSRDPATRKGARGRPFFFAASAAPTIRRQRTLTAFQAAATALRSSEPAPNRSSAALRVAARAPA